MIKCTNKIDVTYLSQEDLLKSGGFDMNLAISAAEEALVAFRNNRILFPDKTVQIFDDGTQERINCLPATLLDKNICGMKWVSVFPQNPYKYGVQNLSALIVLSEIEHGFPIAVMDGTLCSNMRVGAVAGLAAKYLANHCSKSIGFIGSGEQSKMQLAAIKHVIPSIEECRVAAKFEFEEARFIDDLEPLFPDIRFIATHTNLQKSVESADVLVTATSAQAPLLKASWMKPGAFYSHVGGWEDEYGVAKQCEKIVCDDWETVKHRTQTLSRMYKDRELKDGDIYADLVELVTGEKEGRQTKDERIYFNAVGLAFIDVAVAFAMYQRAVLNGVGTKLPLQECMIFQHPELKNWIRWSDGQGRKAHAYTDYVNQDSLGCAS